MAGKASKYIVKIDLKKIQANVLADEGVQLPQAQIRSWLRSVGFVPQAGGRTWLADDHCLRSLQRSEIVKSERVKAAG